jgi:flagellar biogenesis protein FliO
METLQQFLAVIAVLGLLGATLWWLRRRGFAAVTGLPAMRRKSGGALEAVERLPLSATHTLHLVRAGDRAILLACSPAGCQVVESAPWQHYQNREARS